MLVAVWVVVAPTENEPNTSTGLAANPTVERTRRQTALVLALLCVNEYDVSPTSKTLRNISTLPVDGFPEPRDENPKPAGGVMVLFVLLLKQTINTSPAAAPVGAGMAVVVLLEPLSFVIELLGTLIAICRNVLRPGF
jgi:hypothetical protein